MTDSATLVVDTLDGMVRVHCHSLAFDGGSLICFKDASMQTVVAAFSPAGWRHCHWLNSEVSCEVPAE